MTIELSHVIKSIVNNYHIGFAQWNPNKIREGVFVVNPELSTKLDYSGSDALLLSLTKEFPNESITPHIVKYNYPVWVKPNDPIPTPKSNLLVIVVMPENNLAIADKTIPSIKAYADKCKADFVFLEGKTQGSFINEKFRVQPFVAAYERTIVLSPSLLVKEECPNLFEIVPEGSVGIYDGSIALFERNPDLGNITRRKRSLMLAESFSIQPLLSQDAREIVDYELDSMPTIYDSSIVVCSKRHSSIWNPITFPIRYDNMAEQFWIEMNIYKGNYPVYLLPDVFNCELWTGHIKDAHIINYPYLPSYPNIKYTWTDSNNITSYKQNSVSLDTSLFKILCLGHSKEQFDSIEDRDYLSKVNLNDLDTELDNSWSEGRIYDVDFDSLFPVDKKFVGIVSASWNKKYFGLNPIDQFHNWEGAKYLASCNDQKVILCADSDPSCIFSQRNSVLKRIMYINDDDVKYLFDLTGLKETCKEMAISNQIIAHRETVQSLFDFYKNENIFDKIKTFLKERSPKPIDGLTSKRIPAYLTEFVTVFWLASQDFIILPQELTLPEWYSDHNRTKRQY